MIRSQRVAVTAAASSSALVASIAWGQAAPASTTTATTATTTATTAASTSPVFGMMQGVFGLLVVVGLIFAAGWLLRRIGPRARSGSVVQVLGGASVGPREKVVVVRFGEQTLVLGVAPGHVGLLHSAPAGVSVDPQFAGESAPSFVERLRAARGRT